MAELKVIETIERNNYVINIVEQTGSYYNHDENEVYRRVAELLLKSYIRKQQKTNVTPKG